MILQKVGLTVEQNNILQMEFLKEHNQQSILHNVKNSKQCYCKLETPHR